MKEQPKAIVLLSGGLDSATCLAMAHATGFVPYAMTFRYGQRHGYEVEAARRLAAQPFVADHVVVDIDLRQWGGSALTGELPVPKKINADDAKIVAADEQIPVTYVPARNTIFLSFALAWAEVVQAQAIFIGVNAVDYSGYPDCRPEYIAAFQQLARVATKAAVVGAPVTIHTPLIEMTKAQIIRQGLQLGVNYALTTSCYDPTADGVACGQCDACHLRRKGFRENNFEDPIPYA